jgi:hypothetical protein
MKLFIFRAGETHRMDNPCSVVVEMTGCQYPSVVVSNAGSTMRFQYRDVTSAAAECAKITDAIRGSLKAVGTMSAPSFESVIVEVDLREGE